MKRSSGGWRQVVMALGLDRRVVVLAIVLLALLLRIYQLGHQSVWIDEALSVSLASEAGLSAVAESVRLSERGNALLHTAILHLWGTRGADELWIRLPSALSGVASVILIYLLGRELVGARAALVACLFLALSPFHVWYSQEARTYPLLLSFALLSTYLYWLLLKGRRGWPTLAGYVIASILTLYAHHYGLFVVVAHNASFYVLNRDTRRRWLLAQAAIALAWLPWMAVVLRDLSLGAADWSAGHAKSFSALFIPYAFFALSEGFTLGPSVRELHQASGLATLMPHASLIVASGLLFGSLFAKGLASLVGDRRRLVFVGLWIVVPLSGAVTAALLTDITFNVRYVIFVLPAYLLIVARGVVSLERRLLRLGSLGLVVAVSLASLGNYFFDPSYGKEDMRAVARHLAPRLAPGDGLVFASGSLALPFRFYAPRAATGLALWGREADPREARRRVLEYAQGRARVALVYGRPWEVDRDGGIKRLFVRAFSLVGAERFLGVEVYEFEVEPRPPEATATWSSSTTSSS